MSTAANLWISIINFIKKSHQYLQMNFTFFEAFGCFDRIFPCFLANACPFTKKLENNHWNFLFLLIFPFVIFHMKKKKWKKGGKKKKTGQIKRKKNAIKQNWFSPCSAHNDEEVNWHKKKFLLLPCSLQYYPLKTPFLQFFMGKSIAQEIFFGLVWFEDIKIHTG